MRVCRVAVLGESGFARCPLPAARCPLPAALPYPTPFVSVLPGFADASRNVMISSGHVDPGGVSMPSGRASS